MAQQSQNPLSLLVCSLNKQLSFKYLKNGPLLSSPWLCGFTSPPFPVNHNSVWKNGVSVSSLNSCPFCFRAAHRCCWGLQTGWILKGCSEVNRGPGGPRCRPGAPALALCWSAAQCWINIPNWKQVTVCHCWSLSQKKGKSLFKLLKLQLK